VRWLRFALVIGAVAIVIACGSSAGSTVSTNPSESPTTTASHPQCTDVPPDAAQPTVGFPRSPGLNAPALLVEVANTVSERETNLMNRACLGPNWGMLFVFPSDTNAAFWMKDTLIPLSIAFVRADGTIVHMEDMQPQTETNHHSTEPYRYAIEANQGWFAEHGLVEGDKAETPSGISATS
jgi:uncharacterized membrane protein (UPF0127 family)